MMNHKQRECEPFNIAILQLNNWDSSRIEHYLHVCHHENVSFVLLGEYVVDPFFKELCNIPQAELKKKSEDTLKKLLKTSEKYSFSFLIPLIRFIKLKPYKSLAIIKNGNVNYYDCQCLLAFEHWNEKYFFANNITKRIKPPMIFEYNGLKCAAIFGFESHYDSIWIKLKKACIDVVFVASVATFNSSLRWRELLKTRAFLNQCYIIRSNKIGTYTPNDSKHTWKFYGDSFFVSPSGNIASHLGDEEELLIGNINPHIIKEYKDVWKLNF